MDWADPNPRKPPPDANAVRGTPFRSLRQLGRAARRPAVHGVNLAARNNATGVSAITIRFGEGLLETLRLNIGERVMVLVGLVDGRLALWIRKARKGEANAVTFRGNGDRRHPILELTAADYPLPTAPTTAQPWEAHPDTGLLIWPTGLHADAVRLMAERFDPLGEMPQ